MVGIDRHSVQWQWFSGRHIIAAMLNSVLQPIIAKLVEDGTFGEVSYLSLEADDSASGAQFSSNVYFVHLTVDGPAGKETIPLVVKLTFFNVQVRKSRNLDAMFYNEVAMYKEVLPGIGVGTDFYPRMFYGFATNGLQPEKDILILENLKYKDFFPSKMRVFIDIDHVSIALKKIAEFHSFSFILKHEAKDKFLQLTKKLKCVDMPPETEREFDAINAACIERAIKPLIKDNVSVDLLTECLSLLKYPSETRRQITHPEEPFDVICHGDFCNNNVLYKFDENNKLKECIIFDFQFSTYGSPAIDIFFFLYLNTTSEMWEEYWDKLLELYWDTLRKSVPHHIPIPSYAEFLKHFSERVIYGFTIAAFFLPVMIEDIPYYGNETEPSPLEEKIERVVSTGGEKCERRLVEIVKHLLKKDYIRPFIEFCKKKHSENQS